MQPDGMPEGRRIEATFDDREGAERAAARARDRGLQVVVGDETDERAVLRAEMRDEVESTVMGAGNVGPFTKGMTKGIVRWVPIAAAIGAVFGALIGLIPWGFGMSTFGRVLMGVAIGAVAGATAGFVGGGAFQPQEHDSPRLAAERGVTVAVPVSTNEEAERARDLLRAADPIRLDETDQGGAPVRPSSEEATRPVRGS
jgi:hypothetical protein